MRDSGTNTWTFYEPADEPVEILPPSPGDALSDPTVEQLLPAGLALWPRGAAWGTPDGMAPDTESVLGRFTRVLLDPFATLYRRAWQLTQESRALTLEVSLPEWEADYGLPNPCGAADANTASRKQALLSKVRSTATITPSDFVRLAWQEGFYIAIEEPAVFECGFSECGGEHTVGDRRQEVFWVVHILNLTTDYFTCGESECGHDPLFEIAADERLQCLFRDLYPGWTQPVYLTVDESLPDGALIWRGIPITYDGAAVIYAV